MIIDETLSSLNVTRRIAEHKKHFYAISIDANSLCMRTYVGE